MVPVLGQPRDLGNWGRHLAALQREQHLDQGRHLHRGRSHKCSAAPNELYPNPGMYKSLCARRERSVSALWNGSGNYRTHLWIVYQ